MSNLRELPDEPDDALWLLAVVTVGCVLFVGIVIGLGIGAWVWA